VGGNKWSIMNNVVMGVSSPLSEASWTIYLDMVSLSHGTLSFLVQFTFKSTLPPPIDARGERLDNVAAVRPFCSTVKSLEKLLKFSDLIKSQTCREFFSCPQMHLDRTGCFRLFATPSAATRCRQMANDWGIAEAEIGKMFRDIDIVSLCDA